MLSAAMELEDPMDALQFSISRGAFLVVFEADWL